MKAAFRKLITVGLMTGLTACGGGGGSSNYYSHDEVAREFVRRVNSDIAGIDLELVKTNTLQYDYIVAYDHVYGSYDAYYIGQYDIGENVSSYYNAYENWFYYDLIPEFGGTYYDPNTGTRFEKSAPTTKNLAKLKAFKEHLTINKMAERLQSEYGLSAEKSLDTARFAYKIENSPVGSYNKKDYDAFAKELTGSTITEFQNDLKNGDQDSLNKRIDRAGEVSGMGPEGVNKLMSMF